MSLLIEAGGMGGQADGDTFTITAWQATDSSNLYLLSGTFDAGPISNPDDP